jgi:hypothetical protein
MQTVHPKEEPRGSMRWHLFSDLAQACVVD